VRDWPLVGRAEEVGRLRALMTSRAAGGAVLAARAGVGKTRLAREALLFAGDAGFATTWVTATRSAAVLPLGAFGPLLPAVRGEGEAASADRIDLLRRTTTALLERAGHDRLALFVDDAHLLDDMSATLLHQLALTRRAFIVVTVRSGERAPDPVLALWKDDLLERIDVKELPEEAAGLLLREVLGGEVDTASAADIVGRAAGNVMFLRELVLGAVESGTLHRQHGIWRVVGRLSPSDRLVELVGARLRGLDPDERAVVDLLACSESIGSAELTALTTPAVVERVERAGIVTSERNGRRVEIRFAHPLYGDVVRRHIATTTEKRIVSELAAVIERYGARRREDVLRVGTWRLITGGANHELMLAAARTARWRYDFALAERLARESDALGGGFDAALLVAQLAGLQGHSDAAEVDLRGLARIVSSDEQRGRLALARLDNAIFGRHINEALQMAEEVESTITDPAWRDEIASRRAVLLSPIVGVGAAAAVATDLLQRATGRPLVSACMAAAYSLARVGRTGEAVAAADRGLAAHLELATPLEWQPWIHTDLRLLALAYAGYLDEAEAGLLAEHGRMVDEGDREGQATFALALAQQVGVRGNLTTAARFAREAAGLCREADRPAYLQHALVRLCLALALGGASDELRAVLAELAEMGPAALIFVTDEPEARAWAAVATGDLPRARAILDAGIDAGERVGDLVGAAALLHASARLGRAPSVAGRLAEVSASIDGPLAPARVLHVDALVRADPWQLDDACASFAEIGANLLAAEAAADAAVAWRAAGDPRRAAAAQRRAAQLAARCQGARTPALVSIEGRARLTPAEFETVSQAIGGRSNRQIAAALHLSVRTVENRLQRAYEKLGVGGRDELASAIAGSEPTEQPSI
jgi:DNA-binding CsgD family transcriptional regulator